MVDQSYFHESRFRNNLGADFGSFHQVNTLPDAMLIGLSDVGEQVMFTNNMVCADAKLPAA